MTMYLNTTKTIPSDVVQTIQLNKLNARGVYEPAGSKMVINFCVYMRTDKIFYAAIKKLKNTRLPSNCPIRPGIYYYRDFDINTSDMPLMILSGKYRADVLYMINKNIMFANGSFYAGIQPV